MTVRQQIVELIKKSPNQRQVAIATGVDVATLSRIANGQRQPSGNVIDKIANYFKVELRPKRKH
jgi:transcriptional regulator with XRE-family HTH domain